MACMTKDQDALRQSIVTGYRTPRDTPREVMGMQLMFDPAPEWVVAITDSILPRCGRELDLGAGLVMAALRWAARGDATERAGHITLLIGLWRGDRVPMLKLFMENVIKTNAGRAPLEKQTKKRDAIAPPAGLIGEPTPHTGDEIKTMMGGAT